MKYSYFLLKKIMVFTPKYIYIYIFHGHPKNNHDRVSSYSWVYYPDGALGVVESKGSRWYDHPQRFGYGGRRMRMFFFFFRKIKKGSFENIIFTSIGILENLVEM